MIFALRVTWKRFIHLFDKLQDDLWFLWHRFEQRRWYAFMENVNTHVVIKLRVWLFRQQCLQSLTQREHCVVILSAELFLKFRTINYVHLSQVLVELSQVWCDSFDCFEMVLEFSVFIFEILRKWFGVICFFCQSKDVFFELFRFLMSLLKCLLTVVVSWRIRGDTSISSVIGRPSSQKLFTRRRWVLLNWFWRLRDLDLLFDRKDFVSKIWVLFWKFLNRLSIESSSHEADLFIFDLKILPQLSNLSLQCWYHDLLVNLWWIRSCFWTERSTIKSFKSSRRRKILLSFRFLCFL